MAQSMAQSLEDVPDKGMPPLVELIASSWRKSTRSIGNGQCVETASLTDGRLVMRDSMDTSGPVILFAQREWRVFVREIKDGEFDGP